jgi:cytochrome c oxidase subunit 2
MMILWGAVGKQDTPIESYRTTPGQFQTLTNEFVQKYQVGTEAGIPVVRPPAGGDTYLLARQWQWYPVLELKKGESYRIHLSSVDLQHGFSLPQEIMSLNFQVLPGYIYVVTLTPKEAGEFPVVCNEYCGIGHHTMVGKIIVKE